VLPAGEESHAATTTKVASADVHSVPDLTANAAPAPPTATTKPTVSKTTTNPSPVITPVSAPVRGTLVFDTAGGALVPDFRGMPVRSALEQAQAAGIELEVSGSGVGREQSPEAGAKLPPGGHVMVRFSR
jgi:cell division protein FtsI (penicillin-binding protein 3)